LYKNEVGDLPTCVYLAFESKFNEGKLVKDGRRQNNESQNLEPEKD
jgi:hypothetical protein